MTTDDGMQQAWILALDKAKVALELVGYVSRRDILDRLMYSEQGQGLTASQKCAIEHILEALEAVLNGNGTIAPHPGKTCQQNAGEAP